MSAGSFGDRLKLLRTQKGKSYAEMAQALSMTAQGYYLLESGTNGKTFAKLPVLAKILDCRIDDLFPEMDVKPMDDKTDSAGGFEIEDDTLDCFEG